MRKRKEMNDMKSGNPEHLMLDLLTGSSITDNTITIMMIRGGGREWLAKAMWCEDA